MSILSASIWAARFVILVAFLDLFIQFPVVAPFADRLGASPAMIGLIVGIYSATNLVGNLIAGVLLDRRGRKGPVQVGLLVTALALGAYALARTPEHLLAARAVHGLATSVLTPGAFTMIGDSVPADRRGQVMGLNGAIVAFAAVAGPPLAGITRDRIGFEAVFLGGAGLMLLAAAVFWRAARDPAPRSDGSLSSEAGAGYLALWTRPGLVAAYLAAVALTVGLGTLVTHLPLLLAAWGQSASRSGLAFTAFAAVAMVVMGGPLNRLSDRYGRSGPLAIGLIAIGCGMLALATAGDPSGIMLGMGVFGFGFGLIFPSATALVAEAATQRERGSAFGIFYAVYSLGVVIGSLLSGVANDWIGALTGVPFLIGAAVAILAAPVVLLLPRRLVAEVPRTL